MKIMYEYGEILETEQVALQLKYHKKPSEMQKCTRY